MIAAVVRRRRLEAIARTTAMARAVVDAHDDPTAYGLRADGALDVWQAFTGLTDPVEALAFARYLSPREEP